LPGFTFSKFKMKTVFLFAVLVSAVLSSGCSMFQNQPGTVRPAIRAGAKNIITPDLSLSAKVVSVSLIGRFVVLSFPARQMPNLQQTMFLYRDGLKVAEVKITGPQQEDNIVADLVFGEANVGDIVRDQ
jgi:hypothetical protein